MVGIQIDDGLQIADLVCQAELALFGVRLQLRRTTITDPHFSLMATHDLLDHVRTAVETDHMQYRSQRAEHPFPPVLSIHPAASLVTVDDGALPHTFLDRLYCLAGFLTRPMALSYQNLPFFA